jgi:hypothetical protein
MSQIKVSALFLRQISYFSQCLYSLGEKHLVTSSVGRVGGGGRPRILGRNWEKNLKSFPPCYSQSPLLMYFVPPPPPQSENSHVYTFMPGNLNEIVRFRILLLGSN